MPVSDYTNKSQPPEQRRVALVTGGTGAIGRAIAAGIAVHPGFEVVLVSRDSSRAAAAVAQIQQRTGTRHVRFEIADLASATSIGALAHRWTGPLHVLVNNAAVAPRRRSQTPEGVELQFATNVLGYSRMIEAFRQRLVRSAPARVVNVASYWAGGLDLTDLEFNRRRYDNDTAYRQSKQADRMLTVAFAATFQDAGVTVNACHPGDVLSTLSRELGFGGSDTPEQAADTPVWLATQSIGAMTTGRYFEHRQEVPCRFGEDRGAVDALLRTCSGYDA